MALAAAGKKKARKPYTITRPRERWTAGEHGRFLHALQLFGRGWKKVEQLVVTKTATQIRSHAQKHFLKAQKLAFLPKPRIYHDNGAAATPGMAPVSGVQQSVDWACTAAGACWPPGRGLFMETPYCSEEQAATSPSEAWWCVDALLPDHETIHLPLSPDDPHFAQVYRFIGDVFGSDAPLLEEAQLQVLQCMDPVVVETILLALRNLQVNLFV